MAILLQVSCVRSGFHEYNPDSVKMDSGYRDTNLVEDSVHEDAALPDNSPIDAGPLAVGPYHATSISDDNSVVIHSTNCADPYRGEYALMWIEYPATSQDAYYNFARINSAGQVTSRITQLARFEIDRKLRNFEMIATPNRYLVFRLLDGGLWLMVLDQDGSFLSNTRVAPIMAADLQVTNNGTDIAVVYQGWIDSLQRIYMQRFDWQGEMVGTAVEILPSTRRRFSPAAQWDGTRLLVGWVESDRIYLGAVDRDGAELVAARPFWDQGVDQAGPNIAVFADQSGVLFFVHNEEPVARRFGADLLPLAPAIVLGDANRGESLSMSIAATAAFATTQWESNNTFSSLQLFLANIGGDNSVSVVQVSDAAYTYRSPDIAGGEDLYLITFHSQIAGAMRLFAAVVDPAVPVPAPDAGAVADAAGGDAGSHQIIELATESMMIEQAGMVYRDPDFDVVWAGLVVGTHDWGLYRASISSSGLVTAPSQRIAALPEEVVEVSLQPCGGSYSVWLSDQSRDLWAIRFSPQGAVQNSLQNVAAASSFDVDYQSGSFHVVWADKYENPNQVWFLQVGEDLTALGPSVQVEASVNHQDNPHLLWHPTRNSYVITWAEQDEIRLIEYNPGSGPLGVSTAITTVVEELTEAVMLADSNGDLFMAVYAKYDDTLLHFRSLGADIWTQPVVFFPGNRSVHPAVAMTWLNGQVVFAWQDNATTALPQISIGRIDVHAQTPTLISQMVLNNGNAPYKNVKLATSPNNDLATSFVGMVDGRDQLYLRFLQPDF